MDEEKKGGQGKGGQKLLGFGFWILIMDIGLLIKWGFKKLTQFIRLSE